MIEFFGDTETTGFSPARGAEIVELSMVRMDGTVLVDTLVKPNGRIPREATNVHGITDEMVADAPRLEAILEEIRPVLIREKSRVVFYNSAFDTKFFPPRFWDGIRVDCSMSRFAAWRGSQGLGKSSVKLAEAAMEAKHIWSGNAHRAMADSMAGRSVWQYLNMRFPMNERNASFLPTPEGYLANAGMKTFTTTSSALLEADNRNRNRPLKAGAAWDDKDDESLKSEWQAGTKDIEILAGNAQRTPLAIALRLKKHFPSLTDDDVWIKDGRYVGRPQNATQNTPEIPTPLPSPTSLF